MNPGNEPRGNQPTEKGPKNDPNVRDDSAAQPGVSTMSSSPSDEDNQKVSQTAADNFREQDLHDEDADADIDDIDED
jgi:hypothetical protein